uniref:Chromosome 10 open reading frame 71 n=1 Tax=Malurus cyaneus samueli TaxID=2593467 RepID=A0A8C5TDK4_9PASS
MQGNKKHTEGHSDSSSIGSLLDDADREVSSLTDRAFKSLCVAELEDPYNEPELSISPDFALQLSAKIHSGTLNHDIKKSSVCDKLTARNNEHTTRASTFQQLPKCTPEEKRIAKNNTFAVERKSNLPVPGPRNNKHVSKVSSLIKTFDKTADRGSGSSLIANKQPIKNSFQKHKINHGNDIACWNDTDILSIHKELSEFSEASQGSQCLSGKHEPQRRPNKADLSYGDSDSYYPVLIEMSKVAKSNFSHSSKKALKNRNLKVNEPAKKGHFLHSENSAFESWNVHHKKLTEKEEFVDVKMKKEGLAYLEESPFVKGSHTREHKLSPVTTTAAKKQETDFHMKPTPPEAAFPLPVVPQGKRNSAKEKFTDTHKTALSEKATSADPGLDVTPLAKQANSPGSISPSFNITELLTPVIPPKQEVDTAESELIPLTPPPTESTASRDHEESTLDDYRSWDNCRLTASSLLFNLKDVRKRVKSIYTPSPMFRALEEKNRARESVQESTKMNASLATLHSKSEKNITEKDELSDIAYVLSSSVPEKDSKADLTGHFTDHHLTCSSPQTTEDLPFYQSGDSLQQDNSKHQDLVKNTRDNENFPSFRHESNEPDLGKRLQYPAQRPLSRDNVNTTAGQPMKNHSVQGEENERQAATQNENFAFNALLNPLSPEEDVPYSDAQTNVVVPGHEARGKRSTSSSEQSFVSTVEQPLQEDKKSHKERGKEVGEDELQYSASISPGTGAAEKREGSVTGSEQRSLVKEKLGREKREETNSTNSASDGIGGMSVPRSEEPQTPSSSSSTKPSLFLIKDNTFRSPQVIRAVKLPLLRSFSLDDSVSSSYKEMERRFMSPAIGWWASRHRGQPNVSDGATDREKEPSEPGSTAETLDPNLLEDTESFSFGKLTEEDEKVCALLNKFGRMNEESVCRSKRKPTKARHSLTQPIIGLENDQAQNNPSYPAERKTNYFKNHHLSNRKGGSCAKKIITRETISPVTGSILEDHMCSSVSNDTLEDILHTEGAPLVLDSLSCSAVPSPRTGSTMCSLAASSLNLLSDVAAEGGRLEPRGLGGRPASKPPTVPPKTEKALRRAKKLASRRKKMQEQQKKHQTEYTDAVGRKPTHSGETTVSASPLGYSSLHSTFTPTETSTGKPRVSPSPSSTQRKLLQDPDSGQYYVVDLPAEVNLKTFYDPETGKYVQVSVPSLEQSLHQSTSSEMKNSPYASYPRVLPLPASSIAVLKSSSQLSEPGWSVPTGPEPAELPEDSQQDYRYTDSVDSQSYTEPAFYSYHQDAGETQVHLIKDLSPTQNSGLVTLTDLDDFAAEGVS